MEYPMFLHLFHEVVHLLIRQLLLEVGVLQFLATLLIQCEICHLGLSVELGVLVLLLSAQLNLT